MHKQLLEDCLNSRIFSILGHFVKEVIVISDTIIVLQLIIIEIITQ